ncbi:DUF4097 family beta strand repeat-containing protein [Marinihelvus fidelis]|nr:DUF4097 family beta strand repeat-containing protein [Marinihelvus fidelis]
MNRLILAGTAALMMTASAVADVTSEERFTFTLEQGGRFGLDNINGDVTVTGGPGDTIEVLARKKANDQETLDGIEILVDEQFDSVRIETKHPEKKGFFGFGKSSNGAQVTYTVTVPSWAELDSIDSVNGGIRISGVDGPIEAETVNGGIEVEGASNDLDLETVNGSIEARLTVLTGSQDLDAESVNGKITLYLPESIDAYIKAETVNGGIDADDYGLKADKGFVGHDLEGEVGDGSARVKLSTVNGGIKLRRD